MIDLDARVRFMLDHGEELALFVDCPNEACNAKEGRACAPYTHFIRVRDAVLAGHLETMIKAVGGV